MRRLPFPGLVACAAVALMLAACGSASETSSTAGDAGASGSVATSPPPSPVPGSSKPQVTIPDGPPPAQLQVKDLVVGTGNEVGAGSYVLAHYVGLSWSTKKEIGSSWDKGQPIPFQMGTGQVIPGWDQGLVGMRVGGRRELVIPPDLAYGARGYPPDIAPNETLVFVIDCLAVQ